MSQISTSGGGKRVLVIDRHPILRFALRELLESDAELTFAGEVADESAGRKLIVSNPPELVLYGLEPQNRDGIGFMSEIRRDFLGTAFLVYSNCRHAEFAEQTLRSGASGFLLKSEDISVFLHAVRGVLRGDMFISPIVAQRLAERSVSSTHQRGETAVDGLSPRERQVFEMIGRGLTTRAIADRLEVNIKTVETFRSKIKRKLELRNGAELTCTAVEWVLKNDEMTIS